jgi:hypothetical protein
LSSISTNTYQQRIQQCADMWSAAWSATRTCSIPWQTIRENERDRARWRGGWGVDEMGGERWRGGNLCVFQSMCIQLRLYVFRYRTYPPSSVECVSHHRFSSPRPTARSRSVYVNLLSSTNSRNCTWARVAGPAASVECVAVTAVAPSLSPAPTASMLRSAWESVLPYPTRPSPPPSSADKPRPEKERPILLLPPQPPLLPPPLLPPPLLPVPLLPVPLPGPPAPPRIR